MAINGYYRIEKDSLIFYGHVEKEHNYWTVRIGSKKNPLCMILTVYSKQPEAILQGVSYYETCSSNGPMPRGCGTNGTRAMILAGLELCVKLFSFIERFSFTDESTFLCGSSRVSIANMSFILHSKTWYERFFNAEPVEKEAFNSLRKAYHTYDIQSIPFSNIWTQSLDESGLDREAVYEIYKSSKHFADFYKTLYQSYQCSPFISILQRNPFRWVSTLIPTLTHSIWWIPAPPVHLQIYKLKGVQAYPEMNWNPELKPSTRKWLGGNRMFLG
jgi:hypothetical protein